MMFSSRRSRNRHAANTNPRLHCNMYAPRRGGVLLGDDDEETAIDSTQQDAEEKPRRGSSSETAPLDASAFSDDSSADVHVDVDDDDDAHLPSASTSAKTSVSATSPPSMASAGANGLAPALSAAMLVAQLAQAAAASQVIGGEQTPMTAARNKRKKQTPTRLLPSMLGAVDDAFNARQQQEVGLLVGLEPSPAKVQRRNEEEEEDDEQRQREESKEDEEYDRMSSGKG